MDNYYSDGGALIQDPINPLVYYSGGTALSGSYYVMCVSKSTDGGTTWSYRYNLTSATGFCYALAVDPNNNNVVYAGGNGGLFKTTNAGANWVSSASGITGIVYDIKVNPVNSNLVYAGTYDGVFKSTNSGNAWNDVGLDSVNTLLINPVHPDTIYAGTNHGVYLTTNAGSTWSSMNTGLSNTVIKALTINPGNYLFCGTAEGSYRWPMVVAVEESSLPTQPILGLKVFPNPFCLIAKISAEHRAANIEVNIFDALGRIIRSFMLSPTHSSVSWNGIDQAGFAVPDGVYFIQATTGSITETRAIRLIR